MDCWTWRVVINGVMLSCWPAASRTPWVNSGTSIVHCLHRDVDADTGYACSRFSDNTNLEGLVLKPNSGASFERTLGNWKTGSTEMSWSLTRSVELCIWGWVVPGTSAGCLSSSPAERMWLSQGTLSWIWANRVFLLWIKWQQTGLH